MWARKTLLKIAASRYIARMKLLALALSAATLVSTGPVLIWEATTITTAKAQWIDRQTVLWPDPPVAGHTYALTGNGHTFRLRPTARTDDQRRRYPHLGAYTALRVTRADRDAVATAVRGQ